MSVITHQRRRLLAKVTLTRTFKRDLTATRSANKTRHASKYSRTEKGRQAKARYTAAHPLANSIKAKKYYRACGEYVRFRNRLWRMLLAIRRAAIKQGLEPFDG